MERHLPKLFLLPLEILCAVFLLFLFSSTADAALICNEFVLLSVPAPQDASGIPTEYYFRGADNLQAFAGVNSNDPDSLVFRWEATGGRWFGGTGGGTVVTITSVAADGDLAARWRQWDSAGPDDGFPDGPGNYELKVTVTASDGSCTMRQFIQVYTPTAAQEWEPSPDHCGTIGVEMKSLITGLGDDPTSIPVETVIRVFDFPTGDPPQPDMPDIPVKRWEAAPPWVTGVIAVWDHPGPFTGDKRYAAVPKDYCEDGLLGCNGVNGLGDPPDFSSQGYPNQGLVQFGYCETCTDTAPGAPTLDSPADDAIDVSVSPTLFWNAISDWGINCSGNDNKYEVFLDTNPSPVTSRGTLDPSTTQLSLSGLQYSTTYYWKVRANNGVLFTDSPVWRFTTQSAPQPRLNVSPTVLNFSATEGGGNPLAQTVSVWNDDGGLLRWRAPGSPDGWLSWAPGARISNNSTIFVSVDIRGLSQGTYRRQFVVSCNPLGSCQPGFRQRTVTVNLTINPPLCSPTTPDAPTLDSPANGAVDVPLNPITVVWNRIANWGRGCPTNNNTYTVYLDTNPNPVTNRGTVLPSGDPPGTESLDINNLAYNTTYFWKVRAANGSLTADSPVWSFTTAAQPRLNVDPNVLDFSATEGGGNPSAQTVSVWNSGGGTLSWVAPGSPDGWLSWMPGAATANNATISVAVNIGGLAPGVYTKQFTVSCDPLTSCQSGFQQEVVTVNLTVEAASLPPELHAFPDTLYFTATEGDTGVISCEIADADPAIPDCPFVWNGGGGTLSWRTLGSSPNGWLAWTPEDNSAFPDPNGGFLWVMADVTGLTVGSYSKTITLQCDPLGSCAAGAQSKTVQVQLDIVAAPVPVPGISVDPSSLPFTAIDEGDSSSESKTFEVWNSGDPGSVLNWTASESASWFGIDVTSGSSTGPADRTTVTVTLENTSSLSAGSYSETVTISDPNASNNPQTVNVSLTVNAAPPPPCESELAVSPPSRDFTAEEGSSNPSPEWVLVWDPSCWDVSWKASVDRSWISVIPDSGRALPTSLTWIAVDITGLSAGVYTGTVTYRCDPLSSCSAGNRERMVAVTLTISAAPPATGTITGSVWRDTGAGANAGNGIWDSDEVAYTDSSLNLSRDGSDGGAATSTDPSGGYIFASTPANEAIAVSLDSLPSGWRITASTVDGAFCSSSPICQNVVVPAGGVKAVNFGIWDNPLGWFQARDGDVYGRNVAVTLPADPPGVNPGFDRYFHDAGVPGSGGTGGVTIVSGSISADDSGSPPSDRANERGFKLESYLGGIAWPQEIDEIDATHPAVVSGDIVYVPNLTVSADNPYPGRIVVAENVTVGGNVTQINSLLISKDTVTIEDGGLGDDSLIINGGLYAKGLISIDRELVDNTKPALQVNYNPFFLLLNIDGLTKAPITWQEVRSP